MVQKMISDENIVYCSIFIVTIVLLAKYGGMIPPLYILGAMSCIGATFIGYLVIMHPIELAIYSVFLCIVMTLKIKYENQNSNY